MLNLWCLVPCVRTWEKVRGDGDVYICEVTVCEWRCYTCLCNMSCLPCIETNQSHPASHSPQWTPTHFVLQCPCKGGQNQKERMSEALHIDSADKLDYTGPGQLIHHFIHYVCFILNCVLLEPTCVQSACSPDTPVLYWAGMSTRWDWPSLDCTSSPGEKTLTVESGVEKKQRKMYQGEETWTEIWGVRQKPHLHSLPSGDLLLCLSPSV